MAIFGLVMLYNLLPSNCLWSAY